MRKTTDDERAIRSMRAPRLLDAHLHSLRRGANDGLVPRRSRLHWDTLLTLPRPRSGNRGHRTSRRCAGSGTTAAPDELAVTDAIVMTDRDELYAAPAAQCLRLPDQRRLTIGSEFAYGLTDS